MYSELRLVLPGGDVPRFLLVAGSETSSFWWRGSLTRPFRWLDASPNTSDGYI